MRKSQQIREPIQECPESPAHNPRGLTRDYSPGAAPRSVLILGTYRQSLAVARSLNVAGFSVILGLTPEPTTVAASRAVARCWPHPGIRTEPVLFNAALATFCQSTRPILFPLGDVEVAHFALSSTSPPPGVIAVMASFDSIRLCLDKPLLYEDARKLGLAVAQFEVVDFPEIPSAIDRIGYPCVIKPISSLGDPGNRKALILERAPRAGSLLPLIAERGWTHVLVQRFVGGMRHNCHFVAHSGKLLAYFEQRVLRTDRLDGAGSGVDGVSVRPSPERRAACEHLIHELGYSGPGCVQFLVDDEMQLSWFLEINPRLDATCSLAGDCGYDFPRLAVEEALYRAGVGPQPVGHSRPYRIGVRGVWTTGDLHAVLHAYREGQIDSITALRWCVRTVRSWFSADCHLTFRWSDPLPAIWEFVSLITRPIWRRFRMFAGVRNEPAQK